MDPQLVEALRQLKDASGGGFLELVITVAIAMATLLGYLHRWIYPIFVSIRDSLRQREREQTVLLRLLVQHAGIAPERVQYEMQMEEFRERSGVTSPLAETPPPPTPGPPGLRPAQPAQPKPPAAPSSDVGMVTT